MTTNSSDLFSGEALPMGGLTNEADLIAICPQEFRNGNPWSDYANRAFYEGADISGWRYRDEDRAEARAKLLRLTGVLGSFEIEHSDKVAVAGWMLSEMLLDVPVFVPMIRT